MVSTEQLEGSTNITFVLYANLYTMTIISGITFLGAVLFKCLKIIPKKIGSPLLGLVAFTYIIWSTLVLPPILITNLEALSICTGEYITSDSKDYAK